jgi:acyl-CoA synthetase (NDP forming)
MSTEVAKYYQQKIVDLQDEIMVHKAEVQVIMLSQSEIRDINAKLKKECERLKDDLILMKKDFEIEKEQIRLSTAHDSDA